MSWATLASLQYESITVIIVTCVTVYGIIHLTKILMPAFERIHERTVVAIRPPARQATLQMESGTRAPSPGTGMLTELFGSLQI